MSDSPHNLTARKQAGNQAEALACEHLTRHGLSLCIRNFQCKTGEVDLIMQDADMLVFVEVRFRAETVHGTPLATVTASKQAKLRRTASFFLQQEFGDRWPACRFDVVGISGELDQQPTIEWVPAAFY